MELLQWFAYRPATRQQLACRFGETAMECSESLERDLNLGTWVDEIVVVKARYSQEWYPYPSQNRA